MARLDHPSDRSGRRGRRFHTRPLRKSFLIVCEGQVTEVAYFEAFRVSKDVRLVVCGEGRNTTSLVRAAKEYADTAEREGRAYDMVWVVFDHDDFPAERFNAAVAEIRVADLQREESWHAAWSNQAFEVWYLLHFDHFDSSLHRHLVQKKLGECLVKHGLCAGYRKNSPDMYRLLAERQPQAIARAHQLERDHQIEPHRTTSPATANPCTTVHHLVQALNQESP